ncbi:VOC family protein [Paenibacillus silvisoli]|uniref:hypothetical protein n=1 Tax=Paenibacillus silvisoli TaxID=3110539 RepID=UPI002804F50B|nr:hypothetical protein [Paenibacillus silvisoli]
MPAENPQMCYVEVEDVNRIYEAFTTRLKQRTGKIPRAGIPRISKLKDLADDRRFLITDMGGNTLIVGTPNAEHGDQSFYRTIGSEAYAQHFELLFDLMYSKEDSQAALRMLEKFFPADLGTIEVHPLDLAKIHLVALDIHLQLHNEVNAEVDDALKAMLTNCDAEDPNWQRIARQYEDIVSGE